LIIRFTAGNSKLIEDKKLQAEELELLEAQRKLKSCAA
jgi:hypothetical protein